MERQWNLGIENYEKKSTAELGHSDQLSVFKSSFAQNANISRKHEYILVRFDHNGPWMELFQIYANGLSKMAARGRN